MSAPPETKSDTAPSTQPPYTPYQQYPMQSIGGQYQAPGAELQKVDQYSRMEEGQTATERKKKEYHYDDEEENPGLFPGGVPDKHLNLDFDRCFTEHKSTKTFPAIYKGLGTVYKYTKLGVYHFFVIIIGIPLSVLWAILNGFLIFWLVWGWGPVLKLFIMIVYAVAPVATAPYRAIISPLVDVSARLFRQIRVHFSGSMGMIKTNQEHTA